MSKIRFISFEEGAYPGEFLVSEAPGNLSRGEVVIAGPAKFDPGQILKTTGTAGVASAMTPTDLSGGTPGFAGIAWEGVDVPAGQTVRLGVIARHAEVSKALIHLTAPGQTADYTEVYALMAAVAVIVR